MVATVRWKDKTDIGTLASGDRLPVTDVSDTNTDKYTTPDEVKTYVEANLSAASETVSGVVELATAAETDTGTDATRATSPDGLQDSKYNVRYACFILIDPDTDVAADTDIGGSFVIPFAATILQDDTKTDQLAAVTDTAGTTGTMVVDVHLNGTTIMTTNKLDIETTEAGTQTAVTQPDLTTTAISAGDVLTFDIDAVHTTAAKGLKVYMAFREG